MAWWEGDLTEPYWIEITDRPDMGVDLKAPQRKSDGREHWGHRPVREIAPGDIVFHYDTNVHAVVACSMAMGGHWAEPIDWPPANTPKHLKVPGAFLQPGWRRALSRFTYLRPPVGHDDLTARMGELTALKANLERRDRATRGGAGRAYFPFQLSQKRGALAMEVYCTKLPAAVVEMFEPMARAATECRDAELLRARVPVIEVETYRWADESPSTREREPFEVDPDQVDRALQSHARTQNALASWLRDRGIAPQSARRNDALFDLAWTVGDRRYVAEVKSTTDANEERQLRLGLGQILRYRHLSLATHADVQAVLVSERSPRDLQWLELTDSVGVRLVWPGAFERLGLPGVAASA